MLIHCEQYYRNVLSFQNGYVVKSQKECWNTIIIIFFRGEGNFFF